MSTNLNKYNMRTWKDCCEKPENQEIVNGRYKYALKIESQANLCCNLEDLAEETGKKSDKNRADKAITKFYQMREAFNEW